MSESLEGAWCVQQRATWHHKYRLLLTLKLNRQNVYPGFFNGGCVGLFLRPCLHIYRYFWKLIFSPLFYKIILIRVMLWTCWNPAPESVPLSACSTKSDPKLLFLEDSKLQVLSWSKTIGCSHRFKDNRIQDPRTLFVLMEIRQEVLKLPGLLQHVVFLQLLCPQGPAQLRDFTLWWCHGF